MTVHSLRAPPSGGDTPAAERCSSPLPAPRTLIRHGWVRVVVHVVDGHGGVSHETGARRAA